MNLRILTIAGVVAFLSACNQSSQPQFEMPSSPIDQSTAETILMRSLQAQETGDVEAEKADLFPRQNNVLVACARLRAGNGRIASTAMRDENGVVPKITGVAVSGLHQGPAANIYSGSYSATGNAAYSGAETFIWANGRWWIRCNV